MGEQRHDRLSDRAQLPVSPARDRREDEAAHGRHAEWPREIPRRGWWDILIRTKDGMGEKNLSLIAAGAAFYAFLAIPATFTALVSIYGLLADRADVEQQVQLAKGIVPDQVLQILSSQLQAITSSSGKSLGIGLILSVVVALWSARSATGSMVAALNVAYEEPEKRGLVKFCAMTFGLTAVVVVFAIAALLLIAVLPAALQFLPFRGVGKALASMLRWPILLVLIVVALAITYRYAPSRREPRWRWVSWGAVAATLLWLAGSALFSVYVGEFANYNKTYGSLGGVVVLLMWLYVSTFSVLLGAALNAEMEHQTMRDSTEPGGRPMGQRGAKVADTVGEAR